MSAIVDLIGREILDSRGNPTVECDVLLESRLSRPMRSTIALIDISQQLTFIIQD